MNLALSTRPLTRAPGRLAQEQPGNLQCSVHAYRLRVTATSHTLSLAVSKFRNNFAGQSISNLQIKASQKCACSSSPSKFPIEFAGQSISHLQMKASQICVHSVCRLPRQPTTAFHRQAAKVLAVQAASIDDSLLGVPLLCSVGLYDEAASLLQAAGHWRLAAVLAARTLSGRARSQCLQAWAAHVLREGGGVWRAVGLLVAAGCLQSALKVRVYRSIFSSSSRQRSSSR